MKGHICFTIRWSYSWAWYHRMYILTSHSVTKDKNIYIAQKTLDIDLDSWHETVNRSKLTRDIKLWQLYYYAATKKYLRDIKLWQNGQLRSPKLFLKGHLTVTKLCSQTKHATWLNQMQNDDRFKTDWRDVYMLNLHKWPIWRRIQILTT